MSDDLPTTMTAIEISTPGGPEALVPTTRPVPQPGAGEVLIRVAAAGVNRPRRSAAARLLRSAAGRERYPGP